MPGRNWEVPDEKIKVEYGLIILEGELQWNKQKEAAKNAVENLMGVTGVSNNITIKSESHDAVEKADIEDALLRSWSIDDEDIDVKVSGNRVTLTGMVESIYQKDEAGRIAWNAPGVSSVENELMLIGNTNSSKGCSSEEQPFVNHNY
jgi:osmotically-inducible protein OsmY